MESSMRMGPSMAVIAISGSVVYVALQFHKRLLTEFMKKIESDTTGLHRHHHAKKKVRFADDVVEPSSNNEEYRRRRSNLS